MEVLDPDPYITIVDYQTLVMVSTCRYCRYNLRHCYYILVLIYLF
jgi:hypothetical protein